MNRVVRTRRPCSTALVRLQLNGLLKRIRQHVPAAEKPLHPVLALLTTWSFRVTHPEISVTLRPAALTSERVNRHQTPMASENWRPLWPADVS